MKQGKDFVGVSVAFLCHDGAGNILLHKRGPGCRDHHDTWDWGGGGVEYGESLFDAVAREVQEEYGCQTISIDATLPVCEFIEETNHWVVHNHIVRVDPSEVQTTEPEKVIDIGWFSIDSLPEPLHPGCAKDWKIVESAVRAHFDTCV